MAYTIAFFGSKPYDEASFNEKNKEYGFELRYYKGHLNKHNVILTQGVDAVCIFVNDTAGLAFLPEDGLYLSLNGQSAYQTRNIKATFPLFIEDGNTRYYKGKASAPFIPSFQGAYKKGDWTISGSFAVVGGGGKASFDDGLGMFDSMVMGQVHTISGGQITPNMYSINSAMDGSQFIYGVQLGLSYQVNDWLGVFAGGRMNYFTGGYEGFLTATAHSNIPFAQLHISSQDRGQSPAGLVAV